MPEGLASICDPNQFVSKFPAISEEVTSAGWEADVLNRAQNTKRMRNVKSAYAWPNKKNLPITSVWHIKFNCSIDFKASTPVRSPHHVVAAYRYLARDWSKYWLDLLYISPANLTSGPEAIAFRPKPAEHFLPSAELAALWLRCMKSHIDASPARAKIYDAIDPDFVDADARGILGVRIRRMLGVLGNRMRYGHLNDNRISDDSKFLPSFQYEALDRLHVIPSESSLFFFLLERDVRKFLLAGGFLGGGWGRVSLNNDSIFLDVTVLSKNADEEKGELALISN